MLTSHIALIPHEERCAHLTSVLCGALVSSEKQKSPKVDSISDIEQQCLSNQILNSSDVDSIIDSVAPSSATTLKMTEVLKDLDILGTKAVGGLNTEEILKAIRRYKRVNSKQQRQTDFEKVVVDNRTKTGKLFHLWLTHFKSEMLSMEAKRIPPPSSIYSFINYFSKIVIEEYDISEDLFDILEQYIENAIFYRLDEIIKIYTIENIQQLDKHWCKQVEWLKNMSQKQIGISDPFLCQDGTIPYHVTSLCFNEISTSIAPHEMLNTMLKAIRVMIMEASSASDTDLKKIDGFNAEAFFPILVYSLIHSGIENMHYCLAFLYNFGNPIKNTSGEAAYYLCSIAAAVGWICDQTLDTSIAEWFPKKVVSI